MSDRLFPYSIEEQLACVTRELGYRERVYRRSVATGKMSRQKATHEIGCMQAVQTTLREVANRKSEER